MPNIVRFHAAVIAYATEFLELSGDQAEEKMDMLWQKTELSDLLGYHPFFVACRLADIDAKESIERFMKNQAKIDKIWIE